MGVSNRTSLPISQLLLREPDRNRLALFRRLDARLPDLTYVTLSDWSEHQVFIISHLTTTDMFSHQILSSLGLFEK